MPVLLLLRTASLCAVGAASCRSDLPVPGLTTPYGADASPATAKSKVNRGHRCSVRVQLQRGFIVASRRTGRRPRAWAAYVVPHLPDDRGRPRRSACGRRRCGGCVARSVRSASGRASQSRESKSTPWICAPTMRRAPPRALAHIELNCAQPATW